MYIVYLVPYVSSNTNGSCFLPRNSFIFTNLAPTAIQGKLIELITLLKLKLSNQYIFAT